MQAPSSLSTSLSATQVSCALTHNKASELSACSKCRINAERIANSLHIWFAMNALRETICQTRKVDKVKVYDFLHGHEESYLSDENMCHLDTRYTNQALTFGYDPIKKWPYLLVRILDNRDNQEAHLPVNAKSFITVIMTQNKSDAILTKWRKDPENPSSYMIVQTPIGGNIEDHLVALLNNKLESKSVQ